MVCLQKNSLHQWFLLFTNTLKTTVSMDLQLVSKTMLLTNQSKLKNTSLQNQKALQTVCSGDWVQMVLLVLTKTQLKLSVNTLTKMLKHTLLMTLKNLSVLQLLTWDLVTNRLNLHTLSQLLISYLAQLTLTSADMICLKVLKKVVHSYLTALGLRKKLSLI